MPTQSKSVPARLLRNHHNPPRARANAGVVSVLSIAGSDSSGGAGVQADLKTFAAFGIHGLSAITAVTAQNMREVVAIHRVPARQVELQLQTLFDDFPIAAVKIGMLGSATTISTVARLLRERCRVPVVLDPVLVSSSGTRLLPTRAIAVLREELIPLADMLTPNVPEAESLLGRRLITPDDLREAARDLLGLGAKSILLKGGHHGSDPVCDYLVDAGGTRVFRHPRLAVRARGTGCVLSAAIAAGRARGRARMTAVRDAEHYLQMGLQGAYRPGKGAICSLS